MMKITLSTIHLLCILMKVINVIKYKNMNITIHFYSHMFLETDYHGLFAMIMKYLYLNNNISNCSLLAPLLLLYMMNNDKQKRKYTYISCLWHITNNINNCCMR